MTNEQSKDIIRQCMPEYRLVERIGVGSYGSVYKCERDGSFYAIKIISIPANDNELQILLARLDRNTDRVRQYLQTKVENYRREIMLMIELKGNRNIVNIEDYKILSDKNGMNYYIVIRMELLSSLVNTTAGRTMTRDEVVALGLDMCDALALCEKYNIVHRDIKPENILIHKDGAYKLGDFGVAKQLAKTTMGTIAGTEGFMAPEVYKGQEYNQTADIYSLGIVLYYFLNNKKLPYVDPNDFDFSSAEQATIRRMNSAEVLPPLQNVDETLLGIIQKACMYNKEDRYQSAAEMRADLAKLDFYGMTSSSVSGTRYIPYAPSGTKYGTVSDNPFSRSMYKENPNDSSYNLHEVSTEDFSTPQKKKKTGKTLAGIAAAILILAVGIVGTLWASGKTPFLNGNDSSGSALMENHSQTTAGTTATTTTVTTKVTTTAKPAAMTTVLSTATTAADLNSSVEELQIDCAFPSYEEHPYLNDTWLLPQVASEKFGIHMNMLCYAKSEYSQKVNLFFASGDIPDIILEGEKTTFDDVGKQGGLLNLSDYEKQMPNMTEALKTVPELSVMKLDDGVIYAIPSTLITRGNPFEYFPYFPIICSDLENKSERVQTIDDLLMELGLMYAVGYSDGNPPWVMSKDIDQTITALAPGFGIHCYPAGMSNSGWTVWNEKTSTFESVLENAEFKKLIVFLREAYSKGLINEDFYNINESEMYDRLRDGVAVFAIANFTELHRLNDLSPSPRFEFEAILPPKVDISTSKVYAENGISSWSAVASDVKDPERICEFLDWWKFSEAGCLLTTMGIEGETYIKNNGILEPIYSDFAKKESLEMSLGLNHPSFITFTPDRFGYNIYEPNKNSYVGQAEQTFAENHIEPIPTLYRTVEESKKLERDFEDLLTFQTDSIIGLITGHQYQKADSALDWVALASDWENFGYSDYIDHCNAVYQRLYVNQ